MLQYIESHYSKISTDIPEIPTFCNSVYRIDGSEKQREKNQRLRIKNKLKVEWKESGAKDRLNMTSGGFIQFKMVPMCVNAYILGCGSSLLKVLMVNFNF